MIIELTEDVSVRVPEERLPLGHKHSVFHTFPKGSKVNYSSENRGTTHRVHRFSGNAGKYGIITYMCVTEINDKPEWI